MKKIALVFLMVGILFSTHGFSQAPLSKGQKQLNFGVGLNSWGLPVYASLDFAVHKDITITPGIYMNLDYMNGIGAELKADYHFNSLLGIPRDFDFYAGLGIHHFFDFDANADHTDLDLQLGGRWYWNSKWGLNLEFGGGNELGYGARFGLSLKL